MISVTKRFGGEQLAFSIQPVKGFPNERLQRPASLAEGAFIGQDRLDVLVVTDRFLAIERDNLDRHRVRGRSGATYAMEFAVRRG